MMTKLLLEGFILTGILIFFFFCLLGLLALFGAFSEKPKTSSAEVSIRHEAYWQDLINEGLGGITEYVLDDGTRVDILLVDHAIEVDWQTKWAEGVGQAIYYGRKTKRNSVVLLLATNDNWEKYKDRVEFCGLECWVYDTRNSKWVYGNERVK